MSITDNSDPTSWAEVQPIPIPAAAWLFGFALLGLIGYSTRKANT